MKVSLKWLQTYFDAPLPSAEKVADAYTFHAFEIEESQGDMLDVKVLPNRAADCLSHVGLAKELSAILDIPLKSENRCTCRTDRRPAEVLAVYGCLGEGRESRPIARVA